MLPPSSVPVLGETDDTQHYGVLQAPIAMWKPVLYPPSLFSNSLASHYISFSVLCCTQEPESQFCSRCRGQYQPNRPSAGRHAATLLRLRRQNVPGHPSTGEHKLPRAFTQCRFDAFPHCYQ
uniref:Uncharacterized protein n=1 Tax=Nothoprocta perdicaria TaxID=30464 RepID=A0A8C7EGV4_NOTPE